MIEEQSHESTGTEIDSLEFTCSNDEQSNRSEDDTESSSEQPSLPSVSDPSLWVVKCRLEKERLCAISLMNKSIDCRINKRPLSIFSVTVSDKVAGVLYIEAFREIHVREAIKGIENIYQSKIQKVPKKEMHQVYKMDKADKVKIKRGLYVRVNKGLYSGDLAQVIHPSENCIGAICKIVPRLKIKEELPSNVKGYFRYNRPPKQLFGANLITADEIQECFHETIKKRVFKWNKMCFRKGFLIKYFPLKELEVQNPNPKLKEVQSLKYLKDLNKSKKHDDSSDSCNEDDANALNQIYEESSLFSKGEIIKVIEGELANMKGKIESVSLNEVSFKPEISNFKEILDIDINLILKHFNVGDSVRAIYGYYKGEKGLVTKVSGEKVTIFSHILMKEFVINANYLKLSSEISEAVNKEEFNEAKNEFCVYSIVKDANYHRVNIVLDVEKDSVKVMDEDGDIKYEFMKDLQLVRYAKRNVGVDQGGNKISVGDSVKVVCGVNQGCKATIVYINRNSLFLKKQRLCKHPWSFCRQMLQCFNSWSLTYKRF